MTGEPSGNGERSLCHFSGVQVRFGDFVFKYLKGRSPFSPLPGLTKHVLGSGERSLCSLSSVTGPFGRVVLRYFKETLPFSSLPGLTKHVFGD
jgi:hypothetical protein